jgi:hypothetical protein
MKILNIIFLTLIYNLSFGQDTIMYMHSWKNPKKIYKVTNDLYINVDLIESDSIGKPIPTSYSGLLLYVRPNEIVMTIREEQIKEIKANGAKVRTSNSYNFPDSLKKISDGELRIIKINNIYSISHFTTKRISNVGGAIASFSAFAALVIAPLVSINYKTGNFNQKIYYPVLAGCGLGFAIGIPINVACRKNKYYKIKSYSPDPCDNNYYSIQTK